MLPSEEWLNYGCLLKDLSVIHKTMSSRDMCLFDATPRQAKLDTG